MSAYFVVELETTNQEVARRLDAAIETIRSVVEANDS